MIKLKTKRNKMPAIMLSPMIDMMFLLLIFFIVSTMQMTELKTIPVKLPVATESVIQNTAKFTVTIKDDGAYWLQDKVISKQDLVNKAREEQKKDDKFHVVIRADENVQYKAVIGLLDSFKKAGVSRVGLATEKGTKK